MGNYVFGTPKKPETPPVQTHITLQEQIGVLEKRKAHLYKLIELNAQKAKESKTNEEKLRYLKLKVMYGNELKSVFGMLERLESLVNAGQRIAFQKDVLAVTHQATNAIKQNIIDPNKVEDIMDEIKYAIEEVNEVNEILSRSEPPSAEVQAEFDALVPSPQELPAAPTILSFPEIPVQVKETTAEKELRMLATS